MKKRDKNRWEELYDRLLNDSWLKNIGCFRCNRKKGHTKACIAKDKELERERKIEERKEKRRRAKKITMTVGEFEEKIREAEERYSDY